MKVRLFRRSLNRQTLMVALAAGAALTPAANAAAQWEENPSPMLQWFECKWTDMEKRMPDFFLAGYGATWLPPVGRGYIDPRNGTQNTTSAGYDPFDRFALGKPGFETAYGTEDFFEAVVEELHRANALVYVDMVLNHNAGRQTSAQFQADGGYPGFWMAPQGTDKQPTDNWGDFFGGEAGGYYQSENPNNPRYCLLNGDLVSLIDINQASNHQFIRQPTTAGNPANIPAGTYFNKPDPNNARFYPDPSLGTTTVNNPGMWTGAGLLNTGIFAGCNVPARNEPATQFTLGKFNLNNPMAGVPTSENATGYMLRWVQWMLDVHKVDGFRIDAIKHTPSWFFDTYYDSVVAGRRITPDGRSVTPFSFGESVEGNDFTFDRYIRKPNGRTTGRSAAGDSFGNRDALDLVGAGAIRDLINNQAWASWSAVQSAHIDNVDDGYNNGSIGVNHIWSHDNGTVGDGGSLPSLPTSRQQGWFAHAYLVMRPGQAKIFHNGRGITRTGLGYYPREGVPVALGWDPNTASTNAVITDLVRISNWVGRGYLFPKVADTETFVFERASPISGGYSGNCLVGVNRSYAGTGITSYDERTVSTNFPQGTRLIELTGNSALATVDPTSQISDVLTVGAGGSVTIRVPRNQNINGIIHNRGYVIYAPALPAGTLSIVGSSVSIPPDNTSLPDVRQRLATIPVVTGNFDIQLTTTNGDAGAGNNDNADDNAVFRIDQGFQDWNGNSTWDIAYDNGVVPGYEQFVTQRQPLAGTSNTQGIYRQTINAAQLSEGFHYISVVAFRKRTNGDAPLFREFRSVVYVDRQPASFTLATPGPFTSTSAEFAVTTNDRTLSRAWIMYDLPDGADPLSPTYFNSANEAFRYDRWEWRRTIGGLTHGWHTMTLVGQEQNGRNIVTQTQVFVDLCPSDVTDDGTIDLADFFEFLNCFDQSLPCADIDGNPGVDLGDFFEFLNAFDTGC
jgi:hypothetical protein